MENFSSVLREQAFQQLLSNRSERTASMQRPSEDEKKMLLEKQQAQLKSNNAGTKNSSLSEHKPLKHPFRNNYQRNTSMSQTIQYLEKVNQDQNRLPSPEPPTKSQQESYINSITRRQQSEAANKKQLSTLKTLLKNENLFEQLFQNTNLNQLVTELSAIQSSKKQEEKDNSQQLSSFNSIAQLHTPKRVRQPAMNCSMKNTPQSIAFLNTSNLNDRTPTPTRRRKGGNTVHEEQSGKKSVVRSSGSTIKRKNSCNYLHQEIRQKIHQNHLEDSNLQRTRSTIMNQKNQYLLQACNRHHFDETGVFDRMNLSFMNANLERVKMYDSFCSPEKSRIGSPETQRLRYMEVSKSHANIKKAPAATPQQLEGNPSTVKSQQQQQQQHPLYKSFIGTKCQHLLNPMYCNICSRKISSSPHRK